MQDPRRSLWPREHGAYGQLGAPLIAALVIARPTVATGALAVAACLAFLANEPLLVLLGHRGERLQAALGAVAARRLAIYAAGAAALGALGLALSPAARWMAALVAVPAAALVLCAWRRVQRSLAGELLAALVFPGAAAPAMAASGVPAVAAIEIWLAWSLGFACTVVAVHHVIDRSRALRRKLATTRRDALTALGLAAVLLAAAVATTQLVAAAIALPLVACALGLTLRPPGATRLRAIGVGLMIASAATIGAVVTLARVAGV